MRIFVVFFLGFHLYSVGQDNQIDNSAKIEENSDKEVLIPISKDLLLNFSISGGARRG